MSSESSSKTRSRPVSAYLLDKRYLNTLKPGGGTIASTLQKLDSGLNSRGPNPPIPYFRIPTCSGEDNVHAGWLVAADDPSSSTYPCRDRARQHTWSLNKKGDGETGRRSGSDTLTIVTHGVHHGRGETLERGLLG